MWPSGHSLTATFGSLSSSCSSQTTSSTPSCHLFMPILGRALLHSLAEGPQALQMVLSGYKFASPSKRQHLKTSGTIQTRSHHLQGEGNCMGLDPAVHPWAQHFFFRGGELSAELLTVLLSEISCIWQTRSTFSSLTSVVWAESPHQQVQTKAGLFVMLLLFAKSISWQPDRKISFSNFHSIHKMIRI